MLTVLGLCISFSIFRQQACVLGKVLGKFRAHIGARKYVLGTPYFGSER